MHKTVLLAVAMLVWCAGARAEGLTLHVAPNGNDAWTGKSAEAKENDGPFATIARARDAIRQLKAQGGLKEPVSVRIRGGTYFLSETLTFTPEDSGTSECPISYEAAAGERPVLCGGRRITSWRPHRGKIQVALIPEVQAGTWYFRSLFANGVRQTRARYPNVVPSDPYRKGFLYADRPHGKQLSVSGTPSGSPTEFWYMPGTFRPSWSVARGAEIHVFQSGSCRAFKEIVSIVKVDEKERRVTIGGPECVVPILPGDRYFVENVFAELDSPGEWYLNRETGQLFYRPQDGFTEKTEVVAPVLGRIIQVLGNAAEKKTVSHLKFSGLAFEAADYTPDDGCGGYGMGNDGVVYLKDATQCAIDNCFFRAIGKYAVCLSGGRANSISGNDISGGAEGGVLLGDSAGNTIADNHIHHCGQVYKHIGGVVLGGGGASDNLVAHNMIHDISRYGISLKNAGTTNRVEYNLLLNTNLETYDTGGIEVTQNGKESSRSGSVICNNIVGDTIGYSADGPKSVFLSWGIYLDSFASGYIVTNNITYRSSHGGVMLQGGKDNRIENNIFVDSAYSQAYIRNYDNNSTGQVLQRNIFHYTAPNALLFACRRLDENIIRINHNLYFHTGGKEPVVRGCASFTDWQKQGFDRDSVIADPHFVDPVSDNYALQADSPALKLGFQPIDTSKVGLVRGRCRCAIRPAALDFGLTGTGLGAGKTDPSLLPGFD